MLLVLLLPLNKDESLRIVVLPHEPETLRSRTVLVVGRGRGPRVGFHHVVQPCLDVGGWSLVVSYDLWCVCREGDGR